MFDRVLSDRSPRGMLAHYRTVAAAKLLLRDLALSKQGSPASKAASKAAKVRPRPKRKRTHPLFHAALELFGGSNGRDLVVGRDRCPFGLVLDRLIEHQGDLVQRAQGATVSRAAGCGGGMEPGDRRSSWAGRAGKSLRFYYWRLNTVRFGIDPLLKMRTI